MPWYSEVLISILCSGESAQGLMMLHASPSSSLSTFGCECIPAVTPQFLSYCQHKSAVKFLTGDLLQDRGFHCAVLNLGHKPFPIQCQLLSLILFICLLVG